MKTDMKEVNTLGNCINCTWYDNEDGKCHNPDCYVDGEALETIVNPYDDYCTLWEEDYSNDC